MPFDKDAKEYKKKKDAFEEQYKILETTAKNKKSGKKIQQMLDNLKKIINKGDLSDTEVVAKINKEIEALEKRIEDGGCILM